ncbi:S41 family peptidase [Helicobacter sp. 11S03491-1]|uniref:S41 family peptidase n=1 Tax=Helicobacter sp. 11S03491-1 TaxID=1476196 RepID=UPI000BA5BBAF|nr:S41 family peptidase [Helicobacter sp. 11S03491-1]PAF41684.1 peptidase S41 [Helicobacter sp. 11S03491-1]
MNKYLISGVLVSFLSVSLVFNGLSAKEDQGNATTQQQRIEAYNKLTKIINTIEAYYVDDISINDIVNKAIEGLLSNLDAHSAYLTEKKFKDLRAQTDGEFGGLGITIGMKDGALTIIAPLDDTPAQKQGLKSGDVILKINDESTLNMSIDDAVNIMRGKPKTSVKLTVVRKGEAKPLEFTIVRDIIKVKSVHARKIEGTKFLYIRVNSFDKNVTHSVVNELKKDPDVQGIVLDLRNNPGGLLNQAVDLSDLFIKSGVIVSQKGKIKEENMEYKANGKAPYPNLPIVVLVNGGTASASEIVSGALQDHKRALIVGEDTFGKGSVQVVLPIDKTEAIKLTTAKYYLPSGRTIQAVGIKPDILVHPGVVPQNESSFEIKEADLRNHLENELQKVDKKTENKNPDSKKAENKKTENKKTEEQKLITQKDINNDIQLKSGIDILKTWNIIRSANKK